MTRRNRRFSPDLEVRVTVDGHVVIGPVQAMLLEAIATTGSIFAAHRKIGASYAHVWKLMGAINEGILPAAMAPIPGARRGGGAVLTDQGRKVLDSFRRLEDLSKAGGHADLLVIKTAGNLAGAERD
jgi:molybdate transport system regulatory protein